ncbi:MAG: ribonuclease HII [Bacteroidales bacterium]|nr:ribonuclease HII [Bacteroidales bacterium]
MKPFLLSGRQETGCDEAGRGALAGPVYAAAVILKPDFFHPLLNDSKQLTEKQRYELRPIIEQEAIAWAVAAIDQREIEKINILNASIKAMQTAIGKLTVIPDFILVDGNKFKPYKKIPHQCIVGGDGKFTAIAAASILAKTYRDDFMVKIDNEFPKYGWEKNKGYATKIHREAIIKYGISPYHRKTYLGNILQGSFSF